MHAMSVLQYGASLQFLFRIHKDYRIFAGIWHGSSKPDMSLFLQPIATTLKKLYTTGNIPFKVAT